MKKENTRGQKVPSFYTKMFKDKVKKLVNKGLEERQDLFLLELKVSEDNAIMVIIDGDNGVLVEDCMFISRAIEHNLDREEQDFSIEVTSAGATSPLINNRQYKKNIGRLLAVKTKDKQSFEAKLTNCDNEGIFLEWKTKEPKPVGKGKVVVKKQAKIEFDTILEAQVVIKF
ncbi:MAG TPA: ribosome assembly cofactor RimP [Flavobacteriaceae bacterium]